MEAVPEAFGETPGAAAGAGAGQGPGGAGGPSPLAAAAAPKSQAAAPAGRLSRQPAAAVEFEGLEDDDADEAPTQRRGAAGGRKKRALAGELGLLGSEWSKRVVASCNTTAVVRRSLLPDNSITHPPFLPRQIGATTTTRTAVWC
jgi:hypothetical protein